MHARRSLELLLSDSHESASRIWPSIDNVSQEYENVIGGWKSREQNVHCIEISVDITDINNGTILRKAHEARGT
jgi:hypothetical protein